MTPVIQCVLLNGLRCQTVKPTKSFFSPTKGIGPGTTLTLTGDVRIEVSVKYRPSTEHTVPKVAVQIGVRWGKNMKGTDWITLTRFERNTRFIIESPIDPIDPKGVRPLKKTAEALRLVKSFAPRTRPATN